MKNLLASFELSVKLKEKGFDEPCIFIYIKCCANKLYPVAQSGEFVELNLVRNSSQNTEDITCPLYQEVENWLNETHKIRIYIKPTIGGNFTYGIYTWLGGASGWLQYTGIVTKSFNTKNEAYDCVIEEALNLIKN